MQTCPYVRSLLLARYPSRIVRNWMNSSSTAARTLSANLDKVVATRLLGISSRLIGDHSKVKLETRLAKDLQIRQGSTKLFRSQYFVKLEHYLPSFHCFV